MKSEERSVFNESRIASPRIINYNDDNQTPTKSHEAGELSSNEDEKNVQLMDTI